MVVELQCEEVWRQISNYLEGEISSQLRQSLEAHFSHCKHCSAVLDGARNVVRLVGDSRSFEVPPGFAQRLYRKLMQPAQERDGEVEKLKAPREIALGITQERVPLGSHLVYCWESEAEFERGVTFLELGLRGNDCCVLFGHDEANHKALQVLRRKGLDVDHLLEQRRLTVVRRELPAPATLANIAAVLEAGVRIGAPAIRFLGNLGMGKDPLPGGGADDVLELEACVSSAAQRFPCVVVCMYDVNTLPGRIVFKGGFQTHPLTLDGNGVHENPYYVPEREFLRDLHRLQ